MRKYFVVKSQTFLIQRAINKFFNYADILRWCSQIHCRLPMQQTIPHICPSLFSVFLPLCGEWHKTAIPRINHWTHATVFRSNCYNRNLLTFRNKAETLYFPFISRQFLVPVNTRFLIEGCSFCRQRFLSIPRVYTAYNATPISSQRPSEILQTVHKL